MHIQYNFGASTCISHMHILYYNGKGEYTTCMAYVCMCRWCQVVFNIMSGHCHHCYCDSSYSGSHVMLLSWKLFSTSCYVIVCDTMSLSYVFDIMLCHWMLFLTLCHVIEHCFGHQWHWYHVMSLSWTSCIRSCFWHYAIKSQRMTWIYVMSSSFVFNILLTGPSWHGFLRTNNHNVFLIADIQIWKEGRRLTGFHIVLHIMSFHHVIAVFDIMSCHWGVFLTSFYGTKCCLWYQDMLLSIVFDVS